jgi:sugar lactone lactonase YvrE
MIADGGHALIVAESLGRRISRFSITADGSLTDRTLFADCAPYAPDGLCLDVDGAVWAAFPLAHEFRRIAPGGEILERIETGDRLAIACTLGGPDLRTLFLLTSRALPGESIRGTHDATIDVVDVERPGAGSP